MALKILLTVAMALILSLESTAAILPQGPGNSGTVDVRFPVPKSLPAICDAGRQSRSNHRSSLLAPATELRLSASLANSYRNRDQGSRTHSSFGCAVVSRCGRSGRLDRARHRCDGPPSERLSKLETRASGGRAGRGASRMAKVGPMAGGVCWHLGRCEVRPMAWSDPSPDVLPEYSRIFPQRNQ